MKIHAARLAFAMFSFLALGSAQATWTLENWNYAPEISPVLTLAGASSDSCIPEHVRVGRLPDGGISVNLWTTADACFSAFRPWSMPVDLGGIAPGRYLVHVAEGQTTVKPLGTFAIDIRRGGAPETIPATSPALVAVLGLLLCLSAAWALRRRVAGTREA